MPKDLLAGRKAGPRDLLAGRRSAADQLNWSDVPGQAMANAGSSALNLVHDTAQAFIHPIETAQGLGRLVGGVAAKAGIGDMDQSTADAVGQMFADRYGGIENIKKTMATDPVGFISDLSAIVTGGGSLAAKAPGMLGKIGAGAVRAAEFADPISLGVKVAGGATKLAGNIASGAAGVTSGAGGQAIREMQKAGREGNVQALYQMRDQEPAEYLVNEVHEGLKELRQDRADKYDADMAPVKASSEKLSWHEPVRALRKADAETKYNGVVFSDQAADAVRQVRDKMRAFVNAGNNTPYALDRFKYGLNDLRFSYPEGSHARKLIDNIANSVSDTIGGSQVGGDYNTAMRGYAADSADIKEIQKTLSASDKVARDTTLRKTMSLKKTSVQSNFGGREQTAQPLFRKRPKLEGMIAGRLLSGWEPQGLARAATAVGIGTGTSAGAALKNIAAIPYAALSLGATSPRLVGETAYKIGQARRGIDAAVGKIPLSPAQRRLIRQTVVQVNRAERENDAPKRKYRTHP